MVNIRAVLLRKCPGVTKRRVTVDLKLISPEEYNCCPDNYSRVLEITPVAANDEFLLDCQKRSCRALRPT